MADQRSVMKEYRLLEQKLQAGGLSPQEEARFAQLRDLVGSDSGVGGSRPGFDVNAAAARLRESLLPAGLRNRPASMPEPPPPPPEPEAAPEPPAGEAAGLEAVWNAQPFAPLTEREGLSEETLFDPGTLGGDATPPAAEWDPNAQPWDAGAQPYDAGAQPYDPNAPQQWDASGQAWDPNAQPVDPNAAPYDPDAQPYDAGAQAWDAGAQPYDPNAPQQWDASGQAWDPNAQPWDPNAAPYDPNAQPYDAGAQAWDAGAQPYDPNAPQQWDASGQAWDPNAQSYDATGEAGWGEAAPAEAAPETAQPEPGAAWATGTEVEPAEPMVEATWGEAPAAEAAPEATGGAEPAAAWAAEPMAEAAPGAGFEPGFEAGFPAAEPAEFGAEPGGLLAPEVPAEEAQPWEAEAGAPPAAEWDASALPPEEQAPEAAWGTEASEVAAPPDSPLDAGLEPSAEPLAEPEPSPAPLGEGEEGGAPYEATPEPAEAESTAEAAGPFGQAVEPAAEEALPVDMGDLDASTPPPAPPGWGAEEPSFDVDVSEPAVEAAEPPALATPADYGDLSPEQPAQVDALPREDAHSLLAPLAAGQELTSDDDAFAQGFQLASNGSFGKSSAPAAPAWSAKPGPEGNEDWESAPSLDLGAMGAAGSVPPLDLGLPPPGAMAGGPPAPGAYDGLEELDVEEIPVVEGSEALEELPPEPAPVAAAAKAPPPPPPPPPSAAKPPPPPPPVAKPAAAPAGDLRLAGSHRVVVHTVEGLVKRGVIADVSLDAPALPLAAQPDAPPESVPVAKVKAIFFMLGAGEKPPAAEGKKVRVTFTDGRQIAGFSPDYTDAGAGFFMIPADTRTNTGRIWVYRSAVKSVSVS